MAQIGEATDEEKPKFAGLMKGQSIDTITFEEAMDLFKLPRPVGTFEEKEVIAGVGRFGPYLKHDNKFYSLKPALDSVLTIGIDRAAEVISEKRIEQQNKTIKVFSEDPDIKVLNGRWGPYIAYKKDNFKIPKGKSAETLTFSESQEIIKSGPTKSRNARGKKKS
jgi:DNA topoisomerase-1